MQCDQGQLPLVDPQWVPSFSECSGQGSQPAPSPQPLSGDGLWRLCSLETLGTQQGMLQVSLWGVTDGRLTPPQYLHYQKFRNSPISHGAFSSLP